MSAIKVKKLTPNIGAEILGVDLSGPLLVEDLSAIKQAYLDNQVIFFRDQSLTPDQHLAFGRHFGDLHIHPAAKAVCKEGDDKGQPKPFVYVLDDYPEILVIHADENSTRAAGEAWHADVTCEAEPPSGSILYMKIAPAVGGDTLFASMYSAYEALSPSMRAYLEGLTAIHDGAKYAVKFNESNREFPRSEHPVVRTHPQTGKKALFVNREYTRRICQLNQGESDALLNFLYDHCADERFQCRFRWEAGSIAFWDNRCTHHRAMWDYFPQSRLGHRVTIQGDRPYLKAKGKVV